MSVDQRGHGDSTPCQGPFAWDLLARDLLAAVSDAPHPIVGVGHSPNGANNSVGPQLRAIAERGL